jgi:glycerol kinase
VIAGLHPGVGPAHVARAPLEAIAWRVTDIVEAMAEAGPLETLRVDGGLTNDSTLLQIQADAVGHPVAVNRADVTVMGAAMLAGVGAGVFANVQEAAERLPEPHLVKPAADPADPAGHAESRERWRRFIESASRL